MKVLYIAPTDPRSEKNGGEQRTHFLWEALKQCGDVYTVVTLSRGGSVWAEDSEDHKIHVTHVCRPGFIAKWIVILYRKLRLGQYYISDEKRAREAFGWGDIKFDCVVVRYAGWAWAWGAWRFGRLYIDVDDTPMSVFDSQLAVRLPVWMRPISRLFYERWQARLFALSVSGWVSNEEDVPAIAKYLPVSYLRNLAKDAPSAYRQESEQEKILLTVGFLGYPPNSAGVTWFVENVWPDVCAKHPDWRYVVAGGGATAEEVASWRAVAGVEVLGFVESVDVWYEKASAVVAPILSGTGTCIKVLESCLRGRKTFLTVCAARGYKKTTDKDLSLEVFSSRDDFIEVFDRWVSKSEADRRREQMKIQSAARRMNSFADFASVVSQTLEEGC